MPTFKLTLLLEVDGTPVPNFPIIRTVTVDNAGPFDEPVTAPSYSQYGGLNEVQVLVMRTLDHTLGVRLNGQTDGGISLTPGSVLVVFDGVIGPDAASAIKILAPTTTRIQGVIAGTNP